MERRGQPGRAGALAAAASSNFRSTHKSFTAAVAAKAFCFPAVVGVSTNSQCSSQQQGKKRFLAQEKQILFVEVVLVLFLVVAQADQGRLSTNFHTLLALRSLSRKGKNE